MSHLYLAYRDSVSSRFYIFYSTEMRRHIFAHWGSLQGVNESDISQKSVLSATGLGDEDDFTLRGAKWETLALVEEAPEPLDPVLTVIENQELSGDQALELITNRRDECASISFRNCIFSDDVLIFGCDALPELSFFECTFKFDFKLIDCQISGSLWLNNSNFNKHFSLKNSFFERDIHCESVDFHGPGGASFRGVFARSLYIDQGVKGPQDTVWLNEMTITGTLSIAGDFESEIQIHAQQGKFKQDVISDSSPGPRINKLIISKEIGNNETSGRCGFKRDISVSRYRISELFAENFECNTLSLDRNKIFNIVELRRVITQKDLTIVDGLNLGCGEVSILGCSIQRHLRIQGDLLTSKIKLNETIVDGGTFITFSDASAAGGIDTTEFFSPHLRVSDDHLLQRAAKRRLHPFKPRQFSMILLSKDKVERANQYCALKNWFADSGRLRLEDDAYFHMRDSQCTGIVEKFFFGRIFGWGVRLANIALSASIIMLAFSIFYSTYSMNFLSSTLLSVQGFTAAFFGNWDEIAHNNDVVAVATIESLVGIIFVTVFVGAYIRKLLR
jgi:hypothetical protein